MMALLKFPIGWYQLNILFLAPPQEFWCAKPAAFSRFTVKEWREMCAPVSKFAILLEQAQGALLTKCNISLKLLKKKDNPMKHRAKTFFMLLLVLIFLKHLLPQFFFQIWPFYHYQLIPTGQTNKVKCHTIYNSRPDGPIFSYDFIGIAKKI